EHRDPAQQVPRLRGRRADRQAGVGERRDDAADRARSGLRRAWRDHRGAARPGPRRRRDDAPVKAYVITGGSDGIGLECASQVAAMEPGCRIVVVGRNPDRTAHAVGRIRSEQPDCRVDSLLCDFADQAAVRRLAEDVLATCDRIDVLVNNAGTVFRRRTLTADGIEATFAVNHLGGFLLTELLVDRLKESAPARVVFTSSEGHYSGTLDLDDLGFEHGYTIMRAYTRSKLANVLT